MGGLLKLDAYKKAFYYEYYTIGADDSITLPINGLVVLCNGYSNRAAGCFFIDYINHELIHIAGRTLSPMKIQAVVNENSVTFSRLDSSYSLNLHITYQSFYT